MKTAVILFNLGGPDRPEAVEPFLFNLFRDRAIINLPNPWRWLVAKMISARRAPTARAIYARIGGRSPLLENTEAQARALEALLGSDYRAFVVMRYWNPRAGREVESVKEWNPDRILLLPLYPQFSTTTTESSIKDWLGAAQAAGWRQPTRTLCCYPLNEGFIAAVAGSVRAALAGFSPETPPRVLFSAHGLPRKIVAGGDPYQWQVEQSVAGIVSALEMPDLDWSICYQSRVGPMAWIGPSTDAEINRAGKDGVPVVVVPIAFVSEHSETLVELDIEYRELAHRAGVPKFVRVATVGTHPAFIAGLAAEIRRMETTDTPLCSGAGARICPAAFGRCAFDLTGAH